MDSRRKPTRLLRPWDFPGKNTGVGSISFSRWSSWPRDRTRVSCIAGRHFTIWAPSPTRPVLRLHFTGEKVEACRKASSFTWQHTAVTYLSQSSKLGHWCQSLCIFYAASPGAVWEEFHGPCPRGFPSGNSTVFSGEVQADSSLSWANRVFPGNKLFLLTHWARLLRTPSHLRILREFGIKCFQNSPEFSINWVNTELTSSRGVTPHVSGRKERGLRRTPNFSHRTGRVISVWQSHKKVANGKLNFTPAPAPSISPDQICRFTTSTGHRVGGQRKLRLQNKVKSCVIGKKEPEGQGGSLTSWSDSSCQPPRTLQAGLEPGSTGQAPGGQGGRGMSGKERVFAKTSISHARQTSK